MVVIEKNGAYHLKGYSSVSFKDGTPLRKLKADGTPLRVQQTVVLVRKTDEFPSTDHWKVQKLAVARQEKIAEWETRTATETVEATPSEDMTVTAFYETEFLPWLEELVKTGQKSHATLVSYKRYWETYLADHFNGTKTFKNYEPYIGAQFLQNLRRPDDDRPYGLNTIRHLHSSASGIFARATELGYCKHNPWRDIKVSSVPVLDAEQGEAFTEKEVEAMIANLDKDRNGRSDWNVQLAQCVLAVGIWAGLRPSEIAALQWQSVDLRSATITIRKAYVYGKEKPTTKTGNDRVVPFRDKLTPVLRAWWELNGRPELGWVFPNRDGNPVNMNTISDRIIQPNCKENKMKWGGYAFYALRRGAGTLLVHDGWSCEEVAKFLGNSPDVVYRYYFVDKENKLAKAARERSRAKVKVN
ncbi:MAG: tyrosine-type recombinase/integrase [Candidatus Sulfotelmatobacter sp.]